MLGMPSRVLLAILLSPLGVAGPVRDRAGSRTGPCSRGRLVDELHERLIADRLRAGTEVAVPTVRAERPAVRRAEQVRDVAHGHADASDDVVRAEVTEDD